MSSTPPPPATTSSASDDSDPGEAAATTSTSSAPTGTGGGTGSNASTPPPEVSAADDSGSNNNTTSNAEDAAPSGEGGQDAGGVTSGAPAAATSTATSSSSSAGGGAPTSGPNSCGAKLFIGNLPFAITEPEVRNTFAPCGTIIEVALLKPNSMGVRGGFVRFADQKAADEAIATLNGQHIGNSTTPIVVRKADTEKASERRLYQQQYMGASGGGGVAHHAPTPAVASPFAAAAALNMAQPRLGVGVNQVETPKVFVGNVPATCKTETLQEMFGQYGQVMEVALLPVNSTGVRGAIVRITPKEAAEAAIAKLNGTSLPDSILPLQVRMADRDRTAALRQQQAAAQAVATHPHHPHQHAQHPQQPPQPFLLGQPSLLTQLQQLQQLQQVIQHLQQQHQPTDAKLFVGNVPSGCSKETLQELFAPYGMIQEIAMLPVNSSGVCGAMVRYTTRDAADAAIAGMHGHTLPDSVKPLQVRYADPRKPQAHQAAVSIPEGEVKLFVGNLPLTATQEMLATMFAPYGTLVEAFLFPRGSPTGKCGFVRFTNATAAQAAIGALHGVSLDGISSLVVRVADPDKASRAAAAAAGGPAGPGAATSPGGVPTGSGAPAAAPTGPRGHGAGGRHFNAPPSAAVNTLGLTAQLSQLQLFSAQLGALIKNLSSQTYGVPGLAPPPPIPPGVPTMHHHPGMAGGRGYAGPRGFQPHY